jgi:hypothetical protein
MRGIVFSPRSIWRKTPSLSLDGLGGNQNDTGSQTTLERLRTTHEAIRSLFEQLLSQRVDV